MYRFGCVQNRLVFSANKLNLLKMQQIIIYEFFTRFYSRTFASHTRMNSHCSCWRWTEIDFTVLHRLIERRCEICTSYKFWQQSRGNVSGWQLRRRQTETTDCVRARARTRASERTLCTSVEMCIAADSKSKFKKRFFFRFVFFFFFSWTI